MKKQIMALALVSAVLLTACSSKTETTGSETQTTAATTTEATTTTTEATTATTTEPAAETKPEDYAEYYFTSYKVSDPKPFASDFEFVDAALYKDENGVLYHPNYAAGKDIVIRFKSDRDFKFGSIKQYASSKQSDIYFLNTVRSFWDANIAKLKETKGKYTSNISDFLTSKDGICTLTIPAKYAKADTQFYIQLFTEYGLDEDENYYLGDWMCFQIRCEKETAAAKPVFTLAQHADIENSVKATDFEFVNAELPIKNDGHRYYADSPKFPANQDMVITFKCKSKLKLEAIYISNLTTIDEEITDPGFVTSQNGTYTVTIPAKYAQPDTTFSVEFKGLSFCFAT